MHLSIPLSLLLLLPALALAQSPLYPDTITDTTAHENPFFLQVYNSHTVPFAYRPVGLVPSPTNASLWVPVISPDDVVAAFELVHGVLTLRSPEHLNGAADGYVAVFGPEVVVSGGAYVQRDVFFTSEAQASSGVWELVSVSGDGLFGILNGEGGPSTFNGFKVCVGQGENEFFVRYEGSPDGAVSEGCEAIALRTFFGPPFNATTAPAVQGKREGVEY